MREMQIADMTIYDHSGKPKGFKFKITYEHTLIVREVKGRGYKDWVIDRVNMKMNWHGFYK